MNQHHHIAIALENLEKSTGIKGKWKPSKQLTLDGTLELIVNKQRFSLNVLVKNELRNYQLSAIIEESKKNNPMLLIANHIFPKIKEALRTHNIQYLETNGNIYLKHNGSILWIDNHKPVKSIKQKGNRAFTKTGLKVLLHFLLNEEDINLPYRELAANTNVALGNINNIIHGLLDMGYLARLDRNQYKLINKKELLEKWMTAYADKLKPSLKIGQFRFLNNDFLDWKSLHLKKNKTWWGGEAAGDLLTDFLRPENLTLYTTETRSELIKNYRLFPDEQGNINVYQKYWYNDELNTNTVPPLLVYADLMNEGDRRSVETAKKIYHEYLQDRF
jgi:hypothetical protein